MNAHNERQTGYAQVNNLNLYYEIHGSGDPLILLHGSFMTIEAMGEIVSQLAKTRRVIGVELQGHGHTGDIERPLRYELMADDIAALIRHLGFEQTDVFGYSLGGGVALQTAIRHPEVVRKLILISTSFKRNGLYPESLAGMAAISVETFAGTPPHEAYLKTSPRPEAWPTVIARVKELLGNDYDWTTDVTELKTPVLIVVGDADGLRPSHAVEMFELLGGGQADGDLVGMSSSQLAILPSTTHVGWAPPFHGILMRTRLLVPMITEFLDAPVVARAEK